jgi:hypothetical protein
MSAPAGCMPVPVSPPSGALRQPAWLRRCVGTIASNVHPIALQRRCSQATSRFRSPRWPSTRCESAVPSPGLQSSHAAACTWASRDCQTAWASIRARHASADWSSSCSSLSAAATQPQINWSRRTLSSGEQRSTDAPSLLADRRASLRMSLQLRPTRSCVTSKSRSTGGTPRLLQALLPRKTLRIRSGALHPSATRDCSLLRSSRRRKHSCWACNAAATPPAISAGPAPRKDSETPPGRPSSRSAGRGSHSGLGAAEGSSPASS